MTVFLDKTGVALGVISIRQQIVDAIAVRMGQIVKGQVFDLPDGPYTCENTIKGVYPWRKTPFNKAELPAIELWDNSADTNPGPASRHEHHLPIGLQVCVSGQTSASVARSYMADIVAAIGSDPRWGGLAFWTELTGHGLAMEQAGDIVAAAQIGFTVQYRTPLWRM